MPTLSQTTPKDVMMVNQPPRGALLADVASYYETRLAAHGPTSRGVDWNGPDSHGLRHRQFLRLVDDPDASVIDLGCGFGDFYRFLRDAGHRGSFTGYDIASGMISEAIRLYGEGPGRSWKLGAEPDEKADYAVASGILNVKGDVSDAEWEAYVTDTIATLARSGRHGFGFNVLSLSSDPDRRRANLYYADPAAILRLCLERYGRSVALLQDYGLYEFTVLVRHPSA